MTISINTKILSLTPLTNISNLYMIYPTSTDYDTSKIEYKYNNYLYQQMIVDLNQEIIFSALFDFVNKIVLDFL